jgi:hypothetical protein
MWNRRWKSVSSLNFTGRTARTKRPPLPGGERVQGGRITTGVPSGTRFQISSMSALATAMPPVVQSLPLRAAASGPSQSGVPCSCRPPPASSRRGRRLAGEAQREVVGALRVAPGDDVATGRRAAFRPERDAVAAHDALAAHQRQAAARLVDDELVHPRHQDRPRVARVVVEGARVGEGDGEAEGGRGFHARLLRFVVPAEAGTQGFSGAWIPAFAGMTGAHIAFAVTT